jgi:hypothetical protein
MTQQPEALRLADRLDLYATGDAHQQDIEQAAAELRRLHDLCAEWEKKAATWLASPEAAKRLDGYRELAQRVNTLEAALRQAVETLEEIAYGLESARIWGGMEWAYNPLHPFKYLPLRDKARAAIAKATGESK